MSNTYLVTGAMGCIGAWVLKHLVARGDRVVSADLTTDPVRPRLIMSDDELSKVEWQRLDVTDEQAVRQIVAEIGTTRIVHLAGLQIPFCRANPSLGAAVNVTGTVNIFEAARAQGIRGLAYASSIAALGPTGDYSTWPLPDDATPKPRTLYGTYKVANEQTAAVYAADCGVGSVGLRPCVVYGVARDQGMTADFTKALLAAVSGRPFHIRMSGLIPMQYASDVALMFIRCADAENEDAAICNLRNDVITVEDYITALRAVVPEAEITFETKAEFPFPADLADDRLQHILGTVPHTPLHEAMALDAAAFRQLLDEGRIDLGQLDV